MTALTIILVVLVLCIFFAVLHLIAVAQRIEKSIKRVARILDRPRKELAELEEELEHIREIGVAGAAEPVNKNETRDS
jgi:type II secretory pathway component PulM